MPRCVCVSVCVCVSQMSWKTALHRKQASERASVRCNTKATAHGQLLLRVLKSHKCTSVSVCRVPR